MPSSTISLVGMGGTNLDAGYTQPERAASQREVDQIRARVEQMDTLGTRGVGVIQSQLNDLIRDVASISSDTSAWRHSHEEQHEQEARDRTTARRWLIGIGIAGLASMTTVLALLVQLTQHVHG